MCAQRNAAPIVVRRKKIVSGGGHHGGAWKVAYADFVTAMMAFFMLMWLLNATTEKQRKGLADYFNPTIPINRISGGGDGALGGDSVFSEEQIAQSGTGASARKPSAERQARGQVGATPALPDTSDPELERIARQIEEALQGIGGESLVADDLARHVVTRVTDEGLTVEIFDTSDEPLFEEGVATAHPVTAVLLGAIARVFALAENPVAVEGHVRSNPEVLRIDPAWDLSTARATEARRLLHQEGLSDSRFLRITGYGDRHQSDANPLSPANNRIGVILLRRDRQSQGD